MSTISTHVLDTAFGKPAAGIAITLASGGSVIASGTTDTDGRFREAHSLDAGNYQLTFAVGDYFATTGRESFYSEVVIRFRIAQSEHYHVPLLLSPYGYSTYRGS